MDTELKNALNATEKVQEYDENIKFILSQKIILAHILAGTATEFRGWKPEEIIPYIEGEPQIASVPVEPGLTNTVSKIQGNNTEDTVPGEGIITYDIKFYVRYPVEQNQLQKGEKSLIKLLIDIEAQKDFYPGYDLVTRGIYYVARQISSQKGVEFENSEYNDIKKVYSIWICLQPPKYCENTILRYHLLEQIMAGNVSAGHFRFDLLEVIMVNLPREIPEKETEPTLNGMLKTLFSPELTKEEIIKRLEEVYHIPKNQKLEGGIQTMCNFGEAILEQGMERGIIGLTLKKIAKNLTVEETADMLETDIGIIQQIYDIKASHPEYGEKEIFEVLKQR